MIDYKEVCACGQINTEWALADLHPSHPDWPPTGKAGVNYAIFTEHAGEIVHRVNAGRVIGEQAGQLKPQPTA